MKMGEGDLEWEGGRWVRRGRVINKQDALRTRFIMYMSVPTP